MLASMNAPANIKSGPPTKVMRPPTIARKPNLAASRCALPKRFVFE